MWNWNLLARKNCLSLFTLLVVVILVLVVIPTLRPSCYQLSGLSGPCGGFQSREHVTIVDYSRDSQLHKSYMLSLHYAEQLTSSTVHYLQFLNLVAGWNFTGVEPFVHNSRMFGVCLDPSQVYVKYGLLLNVSTLNSDLASCLNRTTDSENGSPLLIEPMDDFLNRSYKNIVVIYFVGHDANVRVLSLDACYSMESRVRFGSEPITDCTSVAREKGVSQTVEGRLNSQLHTASLSEEVYSNHSRPFRVVQTFCVHKKLPLTLVQLMDYIDQHAPHRPGPSGTKEHLASIVFVTWQGQYTHDFKDSPIMDTCVLPFTKIARSNAVEKAASQFVESLDLKKNSFLSIHIRFEKLFEGAPQNSSEAHYQCVVKRLNRLLADVRHKHNLSPGDTLLMTDFGRYGSDTCSYEGNWLERSVCVNKAKELLSKIAVSSDQHGFDPVLFGLQPNSGIVSLVEAESLLLGRALVTLGGGTYQSAVRQRFQYAHPQEHIYYVNHREATHFLPDGTAVCTASNDTR